MKKENKVMSLFDHLDAITINKKDWKNFTESDRKTFSPYMINRFLSMDVNLIDVVNIFQKYTVGVLSNRDVYNLYKSILPKQKFYFKYIKGKSEEKYEKELIQLLSKHYHISETESVGYLDIIFKDIKGVEKLLELLEAYGYTEKQIKKLIK